MKKTLDKNYVLYGITAFLMMVVTLLPTASYAADINSLVSSVGTLAIILVGIGAVCLIAKDIFSYFKGDGGVGTIFQHAGIAILVLALITVFTQPQLIAGLFSETADTAVNIANSAANTALG